MFLWRDEMRVAHAHLYGACATDLSCAKRRRLASPLGEEAAVSQVGPPPRETTVSAPNTTKMKRKDLA
jgi:hypothetical protein